MPMVLTVLGMVAEMELGFIKARQREGIERAKSKGDVYRGRKPTIVRSAVRDLFNQGIGASEIARRLKIGRALLHPAPTRDWRQGAWPKTRDICPCKGAARIRRSVPCSKNVQNDHLKR
jgi:DNA invertase Pin-like site-specific DNA recombinase